MIYKNHNIISQILAKSINYLYSINQCWLLNYSVEKCRCSKIKYITWLGLVLSSNETKNLK